MPWDDPHDHLEEMEHAELRMLRWLIEMQVAQGNLLMDIIEGQEQTMARLDNLKDLLAADRAATAEEQAEVAAALAALGEQVVALEAQVGALVAGQVTDEEISELATGLTDLGTDIKAIYTAPVVEPPVV
jgi:hypothetical protein